MSFMECSKKKGASKSYLSNTEEAREKTENGQIKEAT